MEGSEEVGIEKKVGETEEGGGGRRTEVGEGGGEGSRGMEVGGVERR